MLTIRPRNERGLTDLDWLKSYHSFSFGNYIDPKQMGYRSLRVINDDRVDPAQGFGTHGHRDMEILTYVLEGELEHRDSLGNGSVLRAGEVQLMSAGTGIRHSEFNPSRSDPVHFLQIWIEPERRSLSPGYQQKIFPVEERTGNLRPIATRNGKYGSLKIHQDVEVLAAVLESDQSVTHRLRPERHAWIQVARGEVNVNGKPLAAGDGVAIEGESAITISADAIESEILLFDLA